MLFNQGNLVSTKMLLSKRALDTWYVRNTIFAATREARVRGKH